MIMRSNNEKMKRTVLALLALFMVSTTAYQAIFKMMIDTIM